MTKLPPLIRGKRIYNLKCPRNPQDQTLVSLVRFTLLRSVSRQKKMQFSLQFSLNFVSCGGMKAEKHFPEMARVSDRLATSAAMIEALALYLSHDIANSSNLAGPY